MTSRPLPKLTTVLLSAGLAVAAAGCGSGEHFATAPAYGIVTCHGKPVSGGTVHFSPVREGDEAVTGKPAAGEVSPAGTFVLTTYAPEDGAVVGRHTVTYSPPLTDAPAAKFDCAGAGPVEAEIKDGQNDLQIELSGG